MTLSRLSFLSLSVLLIFTLAQPAAAATPPGLDSSIAQFLDLYSKKDISGLMNLLADDDLLIMGSDLSEVCTTREQVRQLLHDDFQLWDSATFEKPVKLYSVQSGSLITAFFDVPLSIRSGTRQHTLTVRFSTVWKKTSQGLKLVQSSNTTPTVGQSAKDILSSKP